MPTIIPTFLLKKLYLPGSLKNTPTGFELTIKNSLNNGTLVGFGPLQVDGNTIPLERVTLMVDDSPVDPLAISAAQPRAFALNRQVTIRVAQETLAPGKHSISVAVETKEAGTLTITAEDMIA